MAQVPLWQTQARPEPLPGVRFQAPNAGAAAGAIAQGLGVAADVMSKYDYLQDQSAAMTTEAKITEEFLAWDANAKQQYVGERAGEYVPAMQQWWSDKQREAANGLSERAKAMAGMHLAKKRLSTLQSGYAHQAQAVENHNVSSFVALNETKLRAGFATGSFEQAAEEVRNNTAAFGAQRGWSPEQIQLQIQKTLGDYHLQHMNQLGKRDWRAAEQYYRDHAQEMSPATQAHVQDVLSKGRGQNEGDNIFMGRKPVELKIEDGASKAESITATSQHLGVNPKDLATIMLYETGGTLDPNKKGGKNGVHIGLIQFGEAEQKKYGITPGMSFNDQMKAVAQYLKDRGAKPGDSLETLYRIINGGNRNAPLTASDGNGTIGEHVARMQRMFGDRADALLRGAAPHDPVDGNITGKPPAPEAMPKTEAGQIAMAMDRLKDDPVARKEAVDQIQLRWKMQREMEKRNYEQLTEQTYKLVMAGVEVPPAMLGALPLEMREKMESIIKRKKDEALGIGIKTQPDAEWEVRDAINRGVFQTKEDWRQAEIKILSERRISADDIKALGKRWDEWRNNPELHASTLSDDDIKRRAFEMAKVNTNAKTNSDKDRDNMWAIETELNKRWLAEADSKGRKLTVEEKRAIMENMMLDKRRVPGRVYGYTETPSVLIPPEQVPQSSIPLVTESGEYSGMTIAPKDVSKAEMAKMQRELRARNQPSSERDVLIAIGRMRADLGQMKAPPIDPTGMVAP